MHDHNYFSLSNRVPTSSGICTIIEPDTHEGLDHDALVGTQCTTANVSWCSSQPTAHARALFTLCSIWSVGDNGTTLVAASLLIIAAFVQVGFKHAVSFQRAYVEVF